MIDSAAIRMGLGFLVAAERATGVDDNMFKSHFHDFFEIYYLEKGERFHIIEDKMVKISAGDLVIFPPYVMHRSYGDKGMYFNRIVIYFRPEALSSQLLDKLERTGPSIWSVSNVWAQKIRSIANTIRDEDERMEEYYQEVMKENVNLLITCLFRSGTEAGKAQPRGRITDVLSFIHNNYYKDITIEELAGIANVTPFHLCREFKKFTDSTIIQYLNTLRVLHAKRMFLETDKNMTEIAFATGFSNSTHFSRVFRQISGQSPLEAKKQLRNTGAARGRLQG